jgi:hypothetical protein
MSEVMELAFSAVNLPYTILLIVVMSYWLLVILGLFDIGMFDFDLDFDADMDVDVDGGDLGDASSAGGLSVLGFLNAGEVPITFFISLVVLEMWLISVKINEWFGNESLWFAAALAVPNLIFCALFTKFLLEPVKQLNRRVQARPTLIGKTCVVTSLEVTEKFGRCEVATDSSPVLVNARTENGEVLTKGDAAVVVNHLPDEGFHIVTKQTWE